LLERRQGSSEVAACASFRDVLREGVCQAKPSSVSKWTKYCVLPFRPHLPSCRLSPYQFVTNRVYSAFGRVLGYSPWALLMPSFPLFIHLRVCPLLASSASANGSCPDTFSGFSNAASQCAFYSFSLSGSFSLPSSQRSSSWRSSATHPFKKRPTRVLATDYHSTRLGW
jgi:hypothetical protein